VNPEALDAARPCGHAVAVVLAAGSARRFGATKQLAPVDGRPLVAHAVQTAARAGVGETVVVVGHDHEAVAHAAAEAGPVTVAVNPEHTSGQASSLRAGIEHATSSAAEVAVILLADQPGIRAETVRTVVAAVTGGAEAARAAYDDGPGHPVAFARRVWPRLLEVTGDQGARQVLHLLDVVEVAVPGGRPRDVDTRRDLRELE
jgi:molybdenum cofactor cytidylyltransferase